VHNTVAVILCGVPEAAQADWDLNSASWARYFTVNDTQRRMLDTDQQTWRQSLDRICALPRYPTPEDQAGKAMLEAFGRMLLGPGIGMPGPQPITRAHVNCVINAYRARAAVLRSKLTGDALAESQLSPEQHAQLQQTLAEKGFLRVEQIGNGTHDAEFGPITRNAIKQFQQSLGASSSRFLSNDQRSALLENTEGGGIASTPPPPPAPAPTPPQVVMVPAPAPQPTRPAIIIDTHSWMKISEHDSEDGTSYMDANSLAREGDVVTLFGLQDYPNPLPFGDSGKTFSSLGFKVQYNCVSVRSRIAWTKTFSGNMGTGELIEDGSIHARENVFDTGSDDLLTAKQSDWVPMPPNAASMRKERDIACKTAPPPQSAQQRAPTHVAPAAMPEVEPAKPEKTDAEKEDKATARDAAKTDAERDAETWVPLELLRVASRSADRVLDAQRPRASGADGHNRADNGIPIGRRDWFDAKKRIYV